MMAETTSKEKISVIFAAACALMMTAHLQGGKTVRDALFLYNFEVIHLPKIMVIAAVLSAIAVITFARMLPRFGPARFIPPLYILSGILSVGEWATIVFWPHVVTVVLYLHVTVIDSLLISGFFSIINERYDPYSAKKVISRMVIFTALGGLLGAGAAGIIAKMMDTRAVIAMLAILHILAGLALYEVTRDQAVSKSSSAPSKGLFTIVKQNTLIQRMALLMLTLAVTISLLDYLFKATLQVSLSKSELVTFFAYFYICIDVGSLLLQTFVGSKALRWFGLGGTIIVLPFSIMVGGLITFAFRSLVSVTLLRGGASLLTNSFFGPGFELLFTPISPAEKRATKILIDVGAHRSGNMLGGLMIMGLLLLPGSPGRYILLIVMALACAMALLIFLLNRGYIAQLARNLRDGTLQPDDIAIKDTTTLRTITVTQTSLERDKLLQQISQLRKANKSSIVEATTKQNDATTPAPLRDSSDEDSEINAIQDLRSGDDDRIRHVLVNQTMTPALLPHVLPLLRNPRVLKEALNAMRPLASIASGQLIDVLLDRRQHPLIRRRIPLLLGLADNELALQGLTLGLQDQELDVRFRCAEAMGRIKTNHPQLSTDTEAIWQVIKREMAHLNRSGAKSNQGVAPLRYLFSLFGIIFGANVMDICYESLQVKDPTVRGTALEYLDNLLPQNIRRPLWPLIEAEPTRPKSERSMQEIMEDLLQAGRTLKNKDEILNLSMQELEKPD